MVPPLIAFGGGKTLFFATLPNISGGLSEALSVVRRAQRVLLRVEDGRPATFFVGEHFPITLAFFRRAWSRRPHNSATRCPPVHFREPITM